MTFIILYDKKQVLETENDLYQSILTVISDFSVPTIRENGLMFYGQKYYSTIFCYYSDHTYFIGKPQKYSGAT